jgi:hypothetical protein
MIQLTQGLTSEKIIVTLNENKTLTQPNYLFVFTQVTTGDIVAFVKSEMDDESDYPERYNQFEINTNVLFDARPPGEWRYTVYEQENATNTDPADANGILETGKLMLLASEEFTYTTYNNITTYKAYNG